MKMNNNSVNIYWSPVFYNNNTFRENDYNWNILYSDPVNLYDDLRTKKTDSDPSSNFFYCPAFKDFTSSTFVFKNPMKCDFSIDEQNNLTTNLKNFINAKIQHLPSIQNRPLVNYQVSWIFFTEEDIDITVTSPFFNVPNYLKYASIIPGRLSISKWFRPITMEFLLNENIKNVVIEKDEPLFFVSFNTNKKINLIRFEMNDKLLSCSNVCSRSTEWESWIPLLSRYKRFKDSRMKNIIMKEIKKEIL